MALPILAGDVPRVDYVLYTHADGDHLGPLTAPTLAQNGAKVFGTYRTCYQLMQLGAAPKQVLACREGEPFTLSDITRRGHARRPPVAA